MEENKYSIKDFHNGQLPETERNLIAVLHEEMVTLSTQFVLITKKINILAYAIEAIRNKYDTDYIPTMQPQTAKAGYSDVINLQNNTPCQGCKDKT